MRPPLRSSCLVHAFKQHTSRPFLRHPDKFGALLVVTMSANPCNLFRRHPFHLQQRNHTPTTRFRSLGPYSTLPPPPTPTASRGLVIAYRVLRRQGEPKDSPHHQPANSFVDSSAAGASSEAAEAEKQKQAGPSLMVVVPGLFQTLDTIERAVLPLLEAHPKLTVLLVAPPGLPNTHWPVTVSIDGEVRFSMLGFPYSFGSRCAVAWALFTE